MVDLVEAGVDGLEVEQRKLTGRVGFQLVPPGGCSGVVGDSFAALAPTTKVQGSVRRVEMTVSNLDDPPRTTSRSRRCAEASHTCSLAQCPASTR
jgi:hypothetical protein